MKVVEFAGVVFIAENTCIIQKINIKNETGDSASPGFQVVTTAGGVSFTFATEKERDEKFLALKEELKKS